MQDMIISIIKRLYITEFSIAIETIKSWQNANFSLFEDKIFDILTHLPMVDYFIFCMLEYEFMNKTNFV